MASLLDPDTGQVSTGGATYDPGPSSPGMGALLALVNGLAAGNQRQRAIAQQQQGEEENVTKNVLSGGGGMYSSGEDPNATALGVSPQQQQSIVAGTPSGKFQSAVAGWKSQHPGEDLTPDILATLQMQATGQVPSGAFGLFGRQVSQNTAAMGDVTKLTTQAMTRARDFWNNGGDDVTADDAKKAGFSEIAPALAALPKAMQDSVNAAISQMDPTGIGASAEGKSKRELRDAQASAANARADSMKSMLAPNMKAAFARADEGEAYAALARTHQALAGAVTPADRTRAAEAAMKAEQETIKRLDEKQTLMPSKMTPEDTKMLASAREGLAQDLPRLRLMGANLGAPMGGGTAAPGKPYQSEEDFKEKFTAKYFREPTPAEVKTAIANHLF